MNFMDMMLNESNHIQKDIQYISSLKTGKIMEREVKIVVACGMGESIEVVWRNPLW